MRDTRGRYFNAVVTIGAAPRQTYAKDHLVLLDVDFPRGKKQDAALAKHNEKLSEKFKIEGFPTIIVLNAEGKVLMTEVGYDGETPADYINKIKKAKGK
mgnify:CR=1 FL=1